MILFLFFCSGATALVYEVVWSKYLSLMLGSTVQAQTVVLAVFMGGLALGNRLIGARADLLQKPLSAYGYLEVLIGLYAFFFHAIYSLADQGFIAVGTKVFENSTGMFLLKGGLSVGLLLLPTMLMGGTLPLLAVWLQRRSDDAGRWSARFYSTNSLGAVCGAFVAGFLLIPNLGLVTSLQATAMVNVLIGMAAIGLGRKLGETTQPGPTESTAASAASDAGVAPMSSTMRWAALLVALTGAVSMGLEVLASRSLTLIFGASLQAFAVVLMGFILGIGAGSAAVASPRLKRWRSEGAIIGVLLVAAGLVGGLVLGIEQWVELYRHIKTGLAQTHMGYRFYQAINAGFSLVILGLPAALIGAVLPLCLRWVSGGGEGFGNRVGRLLTWNTLGAVVGVLLTGFILMPQAGLRNAFNLLAFLLCVPALLLAWTARKRLATAAAAALAVGLLLSCVAGGRDWRHVFSSGIFRIRESTVDESLIPERKRSVKILFYEDAPDATVTVEQSGPGQGLQADIGLRINGKAEASTRGDLTTQLLLAHLPMLARPGSEDVFVLGLASGISCSGFLAHPIKHLTVADNCEPVTRAVDFFAPWNRGVKTNPVTRLRIEDARTVLKLENKDYDVIVSEPSNPWFASVGSVFSHEFYELARKRLKPGGIMVQWFHVYEMNDQIVEMVLRTFGASFPVMEIWDANEGDLILLGSDRPWTTSVAELRKGYERESVRRDLESIGLGRPELLLTRLFASQRIASQIAGPGFIQTDGLPILEYQAPVAFFVGATAQRVMRFDERTWQAGFATAERRTVLAALDDRELREVFGRGTINRELWNTVTDRLKRAAAGGAGNKSSGLVTPCVFNPASGDSASLLPAEAGSALAALVEARVQLQRGEGDVVKHAQLIRGRLAEQFVATGAQTPERTAAEFAAVAARACLVNRQYQLSRDLLALGFKFDAESGELSFLARLLEREAPSAPAPKN